MLYLLKILRTIAASDLLFPTILIGIYIIFLILARGVMPTSEELIDSFALLYRNYGYQIIFVSAFLEALILVNLFVPGQLAMALGAVFARTGQTELSFVVLTASAGALCGYILDYLLGFFGFADTLKKIGYGKFLSESKSKIRQFGKRSLIIAFIHSNIASFISLAAGTVGINWKTFLLIAAISTLMWTTSWGIIIYILGEVVLLLIKKYAFLLMIIVIGMMILGIIWKKEESKKTQH